MSVMYERLKRNERTIQGVSLALVTAPKHRLIPTPCLQQRYFQAMRMVDCINKWLETKMETFSKMDILALVLSSRCI